MLLNRAKEIFTSKIKIAGGLTPPEDKTLSELFYEAMSYIATKCTPRELLRDSEIDTDDISELLRNLPNGMFLIKPVVPIFDPTDPAYNNLVHLSIDEDLNYAVINKAAALYSREAKDIQKFENESLQIVNIFKANFNKAVN
jgi:hypothetical protein